MDCATAKSRLGGLVSGQLTPEEKAETESHLASCEGCRLEHHLLQAIHGTSGGTTSSSASPAPPLVAPMSANPPLEPGSAPAFGAPTPPSFAAPEPGLVLEPITPTLSTTPDPEASFADLALESRALPMAPTNVEAPSAEERPSLIPPMPSKKAWDFEPVDPPRSSSPPEESITFAEQALHRSSQREGSRAIVRVVLWSGGALAGVALLAVSVWMAMAHRETANEPEARPRVADSTAVGSTAMKDSVAVAQTAVAPVPTPPQPSATTQAQPGAVQSGATQPGPARNAAPTNATPSIATQSGISRGGAPGTAATKTTSKTVPTTTASGAATNPAAKSLASATKSQPSGDATETPAAPTPPRRGPPTAEEGFEPVVDGPAADTKSAWPQNDFTPPPASKKSVAKKPTLIIEEAPDEARPATPPDEADTSGPVGRLHLATVKAHEDRDLEALHKIKTSWKSYIRIALGSERERSKREYADCLWAIQELSGKDADRKEALTAYREYVLHAPAGGADARTVARMRHLEDVLSESQ